MKTGAARPAAAPPSSLLSPLLPLLLSLLLLLSSLGEVWIGELPPLVWLAAVKVVVSWEASVGRSAETETEVAVA